MNIAERTKEICEQNNIWPSRSKGQNFLVNEKVYDEIISAANLTKDDTVLEVGPGLGILTSKLAEKAGRVIAVELDDKLAKYLQDGLANSDVDNIEVINENILDFDIEKSIFKTTPKNHPQTPPWKGGGLLEKEGNYKIVANLPYNITSVFIRKFLTSENKPEEMILMLQKEVAERICAKPGDMSLLALSVQFYAEPEIIAIVPKNYFWPEPKVDSAVIKIRVKREERKDVDERGFFRLAKFGFSAKRKMLKNNLAAGLHVAPAEAEKLLVKAGFNPKIRAEDLGVEDWLKIAEHVARNT